MKSIDNILREYQDIIKELRSDENSHLYEDLSDASIVEHYLNLRKDALEDFVNSIQQEIDDEKNLRKKKFNYLDLTHINREKREMKIIQDFLNENFFSS